MSNNDTRSHHAVADRPRVGIVIVTYNSAGVLRDCLRALCAQNGVDVPAVVIADNASKDDTLAIAAETHDLPVLTVQLGRNGGYAAGINAGIAALDARKLDAVFVMNPDCYVQPDALRLLGQALRHPGRGITVPRMINPDGSLQPSLRREPSVVRAFAEALIGGRRAGRLGTLGELITDPDAYQQPGPAAWATGAAMLISTAAMLEIGPWDESFFLYSEETEFALRAADRGWTLWYEPAAVAIHIGGDSRVNPGLAALLIMNKLRLFRRRNNAAAAAAYYLALVLGETARALAGRRTSRAAVAALVRPSRHRNLAA